jgi:hypothetical protein
MGQTGELVVLHKMIMINSYFTKAERKIWISAGYGLEDRLTAKLW